MKWILSLLVCWSASAQLPVVPFNPTSSSSTPGSLGPTYWWVSSDMTTNVAVGNWTDRIAGNIKKNGDATTVPTNSNLGVGFTGTTFLTNSTTFLMDNSGNSSTFNPGTLWVVFTPQLPSSSGGVETTSDVGGHGPLYTTSANTLRPFASGSTAFSAYAAAVSYSLAMVKTNSTLNMVYFTNGAKCTVQANGWASSANMKYTGRDGGGSFYKGKIQEIAYFGRALTDNEITNTLYQYVRTTYPSQFP